MLQKLNRKRSGFTLVEIMIVVAIIALLASIAVPNFLRSRKRSQATQILEDLRQVDSAKDQFAIENNKKATDDVVFGDLVPYIKAGTRLATSGGVDILGGTITLSTIDAAPKVATTTKDALVEVAPTAFWSPFN